MRAASEDLSDKVERAFQLGRVLDGRGPVGMRNALIDRVRSARLRLDLNGRDGRRLSATPRSLDSRK